MLLLSHRNTQLLPVIAASTLLWLLKPRLLSLREHFGCIMQISPHRVFCCPVPVNESNFKLAACPVTVNESDFELSSFPVLVNELHFELFACPVLIREFAYRLSARSVATRENIDGLPIFPALVLESVHALSVSFASVFPMSQSLPGVSDPSWRAALVLCCCSICSPLEVFCPVCSALVDFFSVYSDVEVFCRIYLVGSCRL